MDIAGDIRSFQIEDAIRLHIHAARVAAQLTIFHGECTTIPDIDSPPVSGQGDVGILKIKNASAVHGDITPVLGADDSVCHRAVVSLKQTTHIHGTIPIQLQGHTIY